MERRHSEWAPQSGIVDTAPPSQHLLPAGEGRVTQPGMRGGGGRHHATLLRVENTTRFSFAHPRARERRMGGGEEARVVRMRNQETHTRKKFARGRSSKEKVR
jgi:hypothetical protein